MFVCVCECVHAQRDAKWYGASEKKVAADTAVQACVCNSQFICVCGCVQAEWGAKRYGAYERKPVPDNTV